MGVRVGVVGVGGSYRNREAILMPESIRGEGGGGGGVGWGGVGRATAKATDKATSIAQIVSCMTLVRAEGKK